MEISLHVGIAAAALKRGEEYALRDWLYLVEAGQGEGHCRVAEHRTFLRGMGYRRTAIGEIITRLLTCGMASINSTAHGHRDVLVPLSSREMIDRYGIGVSRCRVKVPLEELKGKGLRNLLFAYVQAGRSDAPIARSTLCAATRVSKPTQIRGEQRIGIVVSPNYIRADASTIDRMPCIAEGHQGQRTFCHEGSIYIQGPNSYSHPTIARSKRVVHGTLRNCCDNRAQQPTDRRRYYADAKRAARKKVWPATTCDGEIQLPVVVKEQPIWRGRELVNIWGVV